jgi:hypothetical protein
MSRVPSGEPVDLLGSVEIHEEILLAWEKGLPGHRL